MKLTPLTEEQHRELLNLEEEALKLKKQLAEVDERRHKLLHFDSGTRKSPRKTLTREQSERLILQTARIRK